jgi:biopolymer transport protein ExbB
MDSFVVFITKHLFFALLLFFMSLSAVTLVIWRLLLNLNAQTDMNRFLPPFQEVLQREGPAGALQMCQAQPETAVIPRKLFVAGLENAKQGLAAMRRAMANVMELDIVPRLNYLLPTILAIAKIATMVGLLGTVISMIGTFQSLGEARQAKAQEVSDKSDRGGDDQDGGAQDPQAKASEDIGLALWATALGLLTAIPLVFSHVLFRAWIHKFEIKMKSNAQKLLLLVQSLKPAGAAAPEQPRPPPRPAPGPGRPGEQPTPRRSPG